MIFMIFEDENERNSEEAWDSSHNRPTATRINPGRTYA
jgi:hypothetical protein